MELARTLLRVWLLLTSLIVLILWSLIAIPFRYILGIRGRYWLLPIASIAKLVDMAKDDLLELASEVYRESGKTEVITRIRKLLSYYSLAEQTPLDPIRKSLVYVFGYVLIAIWFILVLPVMPLLYLITIAEMAKR